MNGKQARGLRRAAEQQTVGKPHRKMTRQIHYGEPIENAPGTTRAVYLQLKKAYLRDQRAGLTVIY